ncbi:ABC transporter substrate-binding protein [Pseudomonas tolaasii]|uniref:Spermidine/putrescine transport system substrate-binding protein n=1 Tax=Pseudomonas tolaasii NCPPB 2192 TaxID=564423 RepID=A0ABX4QNR5_PSETO|nr:ABC transporter substrate-binding protein [Pseudomonas tolaasii]ARB30233.1 spermidine/putrescine ABC transporter substrate-binding protein [Pseudomonas tolaasii]KAB0467137.1 ABC transporter substrate-binding protein [Pseudomonas tolaasii]MBW1249716.1 ABC transporter substrate-binding protein [Pseudomonas tolaasii]MBW4796145.1 ABC transporter substrate-binding protein [Pseudomonas tolaasii]MBY8943225.1 ABC transporter substrate-binding protein [Pseudomonas tolaasii]
MLKHFRLARCIGTLAVLTSAVAAGQASARDFTVVGWGGVTQDAQRAIYFAPFSKAVGKPVLEDSWDGGYGVLQAKVKAGNPNWDVVQVESDVLELGCADGLFEKLDWSKIIPRDKFLPDAISTCGAGVYYWSVAMGYDADKFQVGPANWADFWDLKKFPGKRSLRKGAKYNLEFALLADGVAPKDLYTVLDTPEGVDRAFRKLDELRPNILWWDAGGQPLQYLASGEVALAAVYNGRLTNISKTEHKHYKLVWPGSIYAMDSWVILKGAEHKDLATQFLAFASRSENQAKFPSLVSYGVPNRDAAALIPPADYVDLPSNPENMKEAIPLNTTFWNDHLEDLTARYNAWLAK